jgi:mono/diheme cytochrome c family protein
LSGLGGNGGPSLAGVTDVEHVVAQVTNGGGGMPAFDDTLSAQEIQDVAAYVTQRVGAGR